MGILTAIKGLFQRKSFKKLWATVNEWQMFEDKVQKPYEQVASVYKAIKAVADNITQANLVFKDWKTEEKIKAEDLTRLFERPNPYMSRTYFLQAVAGYYALTGEIFIVKGRSIGQEIGTKRLPAELWVFNPSKAEHIIKKIDGVDTLVGWKYGQTFFEKDEVIFDRDFNPYDNWRGLSPLKPIAKQIDIDWASLIYNKTFFDNDATPSLMLTTDKNLNPDQRTRIQEYWEKRHKGMSKAHKVAVMEAGLKAEKLSVSPRDMDFIEQKRYTREEILGIWKVPKALFNITDDLNYATFTGQIKAFWLYGLMPILKRIEDAFNAGLITDYNPQIYCEFDLSQVPAFQEDFKDQVELAQKLFAIGFTANEISNKFGWGFDDAPHRDIAWIPFNLVPADIASSPNSNVQDDPSSSQGEQPEKQISAQKDQKHTKREISAKDERIWKGFLQRHTQIERGLMSKIKRFFYEQRRDVLTQIGSEEKQVKDVAEISFHINWAEQIDKLKKYVSEYLNLGIEQGIDLGKELAGIEVNTELMSMKSRSYLAHRADKITGIVATVRRQIHDQIRSGVNDGETIVQIADRVRNVYNMASSRALTIARTETTGTVNGGSQLYYEEAGVGRKQWLTAGDEVVRDNHIAINGEIVRTEECFSNGLRFAGDDGPAEETINCRCTIAPVIDE